jgi:penicillin-binding protein 2
MNNYSKKLGLGVKTGIKLGESAGILAGPAYSASVGVPWYDGLALQAAIGQSDNAFTPLQLSNYTATIANGGTRYKTTLLSAVRTATGNEKVYSSVPEILDKLQVSDAVIDAVKKGMQSVAEEGTASAYFKDYPVQIGGKTGTAQVKGRPDNSVLILFAPYEDPEIAVSIVVERGERSLSTGPVAKAIMDEYFFGSTEPELEDNPDELLK